MSPAKPGIQTAPQPAPELRCLGRHRGRLENWFAHASIYALPARYEPFGLSSWKQPRGCALVLGDIASLREICDAALFIPPDDTERLASTFRN